MSASRVPREVARDGLTFRDLAASDAADLLVHFGDPRVTEHLDFEPLRSEAEALDIVHWAEALRARDVGFRWAVRDAASGELLGTAGFNALVTRHGSRGEIAYDLSRHHWGRGLMRTILGELLEVGFEAVGLHRVEAFVTPGNERSARLLARHGFRHEGRLRGYGAWRGAFWDQDVHALLRPEWLADRAGGG